VIVFRLRNSLLNTILLYDIMLGDPGARSIDWVGHELEQVGPPSSSRSGISGGWG